MPRKNTDSYSRRLLRINLPVSIGLAACVTCVAVVALAIAYKLPPAIRAGTLFYFPLLLIAWLLVPCISKTTPLFERMAERISPWVVLGLITIVFTLTGLYWTQASGAHSGDEGHYLIQAVSLHEDGDLDIRNNLTKEIGAETVAKLGRDTFHISPFSRGANWYSMHPAGLPFLLSLVASGGIIARHLVLGMIAALTALAAWCLCRRAGASVTSSGVILMGFFGSLYAVGYASRCLPEMLGACLTAWLCWCVFAQKDCPWRSALLGGFCCAFLPWAHLRFYPLALLGILFYGMAGARTPEPLARKTARIGLFLCLGIGGILFHKHIQNLMYEGGAAYAVSEVLFSYPPGLWLVFTGETGLLNVFPLAIGLLAAAIAFPFVSPARRWMAIALAAMFGAVWLTSCGGANYHGGATLGGRFLLAVMPLLLPAAAVLWDRVTALSRWWLLLLALVSIALCVLELLYLPSLGRSFAFPYRELPVVAPLLSGLPTPFCGGIHAILVGGLTLCALGLRQRRLAAVTVALIVAITLGWQIAIRM
ncbi:MAG: hypothetical protein Q7J98_12200 [Kiritimatiellia bacterium]|nr:hypothetical protein [Kiritimatiellia bacterium]